MREIEDDSEQYSEVYDYQRPCERNLAANGIIKLKSIKNPMMKNNVCVASSMTKSRCAPHVEFYHSIFCDDIVSLSCALHGAVFKHVLFS